MTVCGLLCLMGSVCVQVAPGSMDLAGWLAEHSYGLTSKGKGKGGEWSGRKAISLVREPGLGWWPHLSMEDTPSLGELADCLSLRNEVTSRRNHFGMVSKTAGTGCDGLSLVVWRATLS